MQERIQKFLSQAGIASRRQAEQLIISGRVKVNHKLAQIGDKMDPAKDTIEVDGKQIANRIPDSRHYLLYKPRFVLSSSESQGNTRTVFDLIPDAKNLFIVGRLDLESEGLILLTNDGSLANQLTHPRYEHEKEYRVLVASRPDQEQLEIWRRGVVLEDGFRTAPAKVTLEKFNGKGAWLRVIMKEGHKRQIREVAQRIGLFVVRLVRVRIASLTIGYLRPGEWRSLTEKEVQLLRGEQRLN